MAIRFLVLLLAINAGCAARAQSPAATTPSTGQRADSVSGVLRVVGSAPMNVRLVVQSASGSTAVTGALEGELRRLAGAEVTLLGRRDGQAFVPTDYRVRAVDGRPVTVGTVEARSGAYVQLRTPEGEVIYLIGAPDQLQPGQKVWVQGPRGVVVQSFGTIRP